MLAIQQKFKIDKNFHFEDWKAGQLAAAHLTRFQFAVVDESHVYAYYEWAKRKEDTKLVRGQKWVEI